MVHLIIQGMYHIEKWNLKLNIIALSSYQLVLALQQRLSSKTARAMTDHYFDFILVEKLLDRSSTILITCFV